MDVEMPPNTVEVVNRAGWRAWLAENHGRPTGVWLVMYKKNSGKPTLTYDDAVEEALCFGWIDSTRRTLDEARSILYFAPRRKGTGWSRPNKERVEKLLAAGLMEPAGLAKVQAAKEDGSWSKLDAVDALEIPPDLEAALAAYPNAARNFDAFPRSVKRAALERISSAKRPETRAKRIAEVARLSEANIRP